MSPVNEQALIGAKEIAEYLRWPVQRVASRSKRMQAAKCLFIQRLGQPKNQKRYLYTFPSLLQRYFATGGK